MSNWKLVFEDDFNEPKLNEEVWHKDTGLIRNREPQYYTKEDRNCFIEDGCLVIQTLREEYEGAHYTSAEVTTQFSHSWTYGRFEMRAKLPRSRSVWPAFWTLGTNIHEVNWPLCGEIDVMEKLGGTPLRERQTIATLHWLSAETGEHRESGGTSNGVYTYDKELCEDFHIYAVEWTKEKFVWYFDDTVVYECDITPDMQGSFDKPHYILLNTALENWDENSCPNEETDLPQRYVIDYVRVYQEA